MIKNIVVRPLFLGSVLVLVLLVVAFFAISIPTHAAPVHVTTVAGQSNIAQAPGKPAHFSPKTLSCTRKTGQTCISIKNTTKTSQSVLLNGSVVFTLAPKQVQQVTYTNAGTYVYSLSSNTKATLTVTVS